MKTLKVLCGKLTLKGGKEYRAGDTFTAPDNDDTASMVDLRMALDLGDRGAVAAYQHDPRAFRHIQVGNADNVRRGRVERIGGERRPVSDEVRREHERDRLILEQAFRNTDYVQGPRVDWRRRPANDPIRIEIERDRDRLRLAGVL